MRHKRVGFKLNRSKGARRALLLNLALELIQHEQIQTTKAKAQMVRPFLEKLITMGKTNTLHIRRLLCSKLGGGEYVKKMVSKILDTLSPRCKSRPGGYLRIVKAGFRVGDNAPRVVIGFVDQ